MPKTYVDEMGIVRLIPKKPKLKPEGVLDLFSGDSGQSFELGSQIGDGLVSALTGASNADQEPSQKKHPPLAHRNDPPAAKQGARHITESGKAAAHKRLILAKIKAHPGLTVKELAAKIHSLSFDQVQKRHSELKKENKIRRVGERKCTITGKKAGIYE